MENYPEPRSTARVLAEYPNAGKYLLVIEHIAKITLTRGERDRALVALNWHHAGVSHAPAEVTAEHRESHGATRRVFDARVRLGLLPDGTWEQVEFIVAVGDFVMVQR